MKTYNITKSSVETSYGSATMLKVGFGEAAGNDVIVRDAELALKALGEIGGKLCLINGPASLPVAFVIAHGVCHLFGAVACFDPKIGGYITCVTHGDIELGTIITQ